MAVGRVAGRTLATQRQEGLDQRGSVACSNYVSICGSPVIQD